MCVCVSGSAAVGLEHAVAAYWLVVYEVICDLPINLTSLTLDAANKARPRV